MTCLTFHRKVKLDLLTLTKKGRWKAPQFSSCFSPFAKKKDLGAKELSARYTFHIIFSPHFDYFLPSRGKCSAASVVELSLGGLNRWLMVISLHACVRVCM